MTVSGTGNYKKCTVMVEHIESIISTSSKFFIISLELTCVNYRINVANCLICAEYYFGHIYKIFKINWNSHLYA